MLALGWRAVDAFVTADAVRVDSETAEHSVMEPMDGAASKP